jgi:hypothetical protein
VTETSRSAHRKRSWTLLGGGALLAVAGGVFLAVGTDRELRAWAMVAGGVVLALVGAYRFARPNTELGEASREHGWRWDLGWVVGGTVVGSVLFGLGVGNVGEEMSRPAAFGVGALAGLVAGLFVVVRGRVARGARDAGRRLREG